MRIFVPKFVWNVTLPEPELYIPRLYSPLICVRVNAKMLTVFEVPVNIMLEFLKLVDATPAIDNVVPSVYTAVFAVVAKLTLLAVVDVVDVVALPVKAPVNVVDVIAGAFKTPVDGIYDNTPVVSSTYNGVDAPATDFMNGI